MNKKVVFATTLKKRFESESGDQISFVAYLVTKMTCFHITMVDHVWEVIKGLEQCYTIDCGLVEVLIQFQNNY